MSYFQGWEEIKVEGSTVPFYKKQLDEDNINELIGFDTTKCVPPEPMINALVALNLVKDKTTKVIMINHRYPVALIPKVGDSFEMKSEDLNGGAVKIEFILKDGIKAPKFDTTDVAH